MPENPLLLVDHLVEAREELVRGEAGLHRALDRAAVHALIDIAESLRALRPSSDLGRAVNRIAERRETP